MDKNNFAIFGFVIVGILALVILQNSQLTGEASRNFQTTIELDPDEYLFRIGERKIIDDAAIMLVRIADSDEVIIDIGGVRKSVNKYGIRIINGVQIESISVSENSAILKVLNLEKKQTTCVDSDSGDIYLKGRCDDRFYPNGVDDFCDFDTLKEYNCGYDQYVDEVHCLKHVVECSDGCSTGACTVK
ncbi:hypothetical protein HYT56_02285 [Candidatus Woesearchaeota archaeon]|nr:hypothetical protein [Candidatus Woesearchaeota archaeon]